MSTSPIQTTRVLFYKQLTLSNRTITAFPMPESCQSPNKAVEYISRLNNTVHAYGEVYFLDSNCMMYPTGAVTGNNIAITIKVPYDPLAQEGRN